MQISNYLQQQLLAEEVELHSVKHSLQHMEQEILKHLWDLRRQEGPA
jgi:F-type H+-transporting ATPase subunit epsilon